MKYIFFSFIATSVFFHGAHADVKEFDAKNLSNLIVQNTSGDVKINSGTGKYASVDFEKKEYDPKKCKMTIENKSKNLLMKVEKIGIFSNNDCRVDFNITVPKSTDLNLETGSGNLNVHDTNGKLHFKIGSGNLKADGNFDEVNGNSGSGNVFIKGLHKDTTLRVGSGNIDLYFAQNTKHGELDVRSGSGDVNLFFPPKITLSTDFESGSGQFNSQFQNDKKGLYKIFVRTGAGDLSIKSID